MTGTSQLAETVEFAENPEPRCPCILLLDTSNSMLGDPINALNAGLRTLKVELTKDTLASRRVDVAVVTFDSHVRLVQPFVTADRFEPPTLRTGGVTCMGAAIHQALDMVQARKAQYRANGVSYYRPWVFLITDGEPEGEAKDAVESAARRLKDDETNKRVAFFAVGVERANMPRLSEIVVRPPVTLKGLNFAEMFVWLSASMQRISRSREDEQVALPPPGWTAD